MHRHSKGFSLIELLVVIAIIAILAAILFPIFLLAKEKGREATCKSNLKQISHAVQMYVDDWNGCFADQTSAGMAYDNSYNPADGGTWLLNFEHRYRDNTGKAPAGFGKAIWHYTKNFAIFKCPSEPRYGIKSKYVGHRWEDPTIEKGMSTYFYKHALTVNANQHLAPLRQSAIPQPGKVSIIYEEAWHTCKENPLLWNTPQLGPTKRVQAVFTDGHVGHIDIPFNTATSYDGNWYHYDNSRDKFHPAHCWDVTRGARDIY